MTTTILSESHGITQDQCTMRHGGVTARLVYDRMGREASFVVLDESGREVRRIEMGGIADGETTGELMRRGFHAIGIPWTNEP